MAKKVESSSSSKSYIISTSTLKQPYDIKSVTKVDNLENELPQPIGSEGASGRDDQYTKLLETYVKRFPREQRGYFVMKWIFFLTVLLAFIGLIVGSIVLLFKLANNNGCMRVDHIVYAVTALCSIVSSMIVLPRIIAKHLFPARRDNEILKLIQTLIEDDRHIRDAQEKRILKQIEKQEKASTMEDDD